MIFKRSFISELANSAGGVFTVLFTIILAVGMVQVLSLAAGGGIGNSAVFQMIVYQSLIFLAPLVAVSLFVAVLMTMMRIWQDNEMVIWQSAGGRSLLSWVAPLVTFVLPVIFAAGLLSVVISPWARSQADLSRAAFAQQDDVNRIAPGRFIETMGGRRIFFVERIGDKPNKVGRIFMAETHAGSEAAVMAEEGEVTVNKEGDRYIMLHNGRRYELASDSAQTRLVEFDRYGVRVDIKLDRPLASTQTQAMPLSGLLANLTDANWAELFWRFSWPLAAFNLSLLALPLSCTSPRAGRSLNLVVAALVFILYLNLISICQTWIEQGALSFWGGIAYLHGGILVITVLCILRYVFRLSWLPPSWTWRTIGRRLGARVKAGSER